MCNIFGLKQISGHLISATILSACLISVSQAATLPDVPVPFKSGTGAIMRDTIYIGLGSAEKSWYRLDMRAREKGWTKIADFPGTPRDQAMTLVLNNSLYVFGGSGKTDSDGSTLTALTDVYRYTPEDDRWEKIDSHPPRGFVGHVGVSLNGSQALILGGVNKQIFDGYFRDLEKYKADDAAKQQVIQRYFNQPAPDYFFNRDALLYDADRNQWRALGVTPFDGTAGAALVRSGERITLINGEIKPGLRTDQIHYGAWSGSHLIWNGRAQLPPPADSVQQEGLAGAYAGFSGATLLVAGGANFPGAQERYQKQHYYAHEGLDKTWRRTVYGQHDNRWQVMGKLPQPLGYGVTIQYGNSLYLIGGETQQGKAVSKVVSLTVRDGKLNIK